MNIILFDTEARKKLFPLTLTRAVADLRMGIFTIKERWEKMSGCQVFVLTDAYLQPLYQAATAGEYVFVDAGVMPDTALIQRITALAVNEAIKDENGLIAGKTVIGGLPSIHEIASVFKNVTSVSPVKRLSFPFQLFQWNSEMITMDFKLATKGRTSVNANDGVRITNPSAVFIEDGASVNHSFLNASEGPVYIGKNALVMEGCLIRGPFVLGEGAVLKMGAKIYGATTIGPYSTAGGEIKNSILTGYSNKAHDGYLGDSVIGEWCNLGAGTTNSNVKNTAACIKQYNYDSNDYIEAGNKCGLIIGDYSRTAINSSINTGAVIGICCNVFGEGLLPKFIPDFAWGTKEETRYQFEKSLQDIANWKKMKNKTITPQETQVLKHIFELCDTNNFNS